MVDNLSFLNAVKNLKLEEMEMEADSKVLNYFLGNYKQESNQNNYILIEARFSYQSGI